MNILPNDKVICPVCDREYMVCDLINVVVYEDDPFSAVKIGHDDYIGDCPRCQEMLYIDDVI